MVLKAKKSTREILNKEEIMKDVLKEKTETITFQIPESLKEELQIKAIRNKETFKSLLIKLIQEYIAR